MSLPPILLPLALRYQFAYMLLLALPIACITWTVTHEEVFREPRDYCKEKCAKSARVYQRKFFYLFTCEYCFSHYVAALFLILMRFELLYQGWRGYLISEFALVWMANIYMSVFNRLRLEIKYENTLITTEQAKAESNTAQGSPSTI